jgi:mannosyltransferase
VTSAQVGTDLVEAQPQDAGARRVRRRHRAVLWLPALLVLGLGFLGLDRHSVWRDEAASLVAVDRSLLELWAMLAQVESVHAVYYTFLHVWLQLGDGEVWARVPSVLAMAVATGLLAVVGARLVSVPVGLVAGLLFAVNPSVSYYAQEARSTALVAAFALLATWLLLRSLERRRRWWVGYAVVCAVLVGLNLLALLVPAAHAVTLLLWRRRRALLPWAVAATPAVLVAVVLGVVAGTQPYQIGWIPEPGLSSVRDFVLLALGPNLVVAGLVAALVLVAVLPTRDEAVRRLRALALPLAVLPSVVLVLVSLVHPIFVPRYVFPSAAAVSLLAAVGVVRLGRLVATRAGGRGVVVVAVAAVLVVGVGGIGAQRLDRTAASRPDDLAAAARVVATAARPGDALLFLPSNRRLVALVYPRSFAGLRDIGVAESPVQADNLMGRPLPLPAVLRNISTSDRVWALGRPGLALQPVDQDARAELTLLERDFEPVPYAGARGVGITLFVRRTTPS